MQKNYKLMTMSSAINEAITVAMKKDKKLLCFGLGTTDPKGIFSTTLNLEKKFGSGRVFDVPASENALTGVSIGLGLSKVRTVVTHQRLDFFLLAMD
jgi:pyruvate dehydrogenase E1 component beta subunit